MANVKISDLPAASTPLTGTELVPIVQSGITSQTTTGAVIAPLATSAGSSLVGYLPSGTNAVATTVQAKLRETVSILDFGADPTGSTDSTSAINSAIAEALSLNKILFAPAGKYLFASGITIPQNFPGIIGEGIFHTYFFYSGTGTAITLTANGSLGIYSDFQVRAGIPGNSSATARSVARNGIYWNCYQGQGRITNVKTQYFNGFGQKFEAIWDSVVTNVITEECGNSSEYAFSVIDGTDTSNHTNFNRVQVEYSYTKAIYFSGLNNVLIGLHSERTVGNGTDYTHIFEGDICVIDGRIEATSNVKTKIGVAVGFIKNVKFNTGTVDFFWGSRLNNAATIENCVFLGQVLISSVNLRHYDFYNCLFNDVFLTQYIEKQTRLISCYCYASVQAQAGAKIFLYRTDTNAAITGTSNDTIECYECNLAYIPTTANVKMESCHITNAHTTPYAQQITSLYCTFDAAITIQNNLVKWVSDYCVYSNGVILGVGNPGWAFGPMDTFSSASAGFNAAPLGGTWKQGSRGYNPNPTVGNPKSRVCTVGGTPGTWVSEGVL